MCVKILPTVSTGMPLIKYAILSTITFSNVQEQVTIISVPTCSTRHVTPDDDCGGLVVDAKKNGKK